MKVLGHSNELESIVGDNRISKLVIVASPSESAMVEMRAFCHDRSLRLTVFGVRETPLDE